MRTVGTIQINKTKSLFALAALFLLAGILLSERISCPLIIRYLSEDKSLEEGTLALLRNIRIGAITSGIVIALLGIFNEMGRQRTLPYAGSPSMKRLLLVLILCLATYLIYVPSYNAMRMLNSDPAKYAVSAYNIYAGKGFIITLNHHDYPSHILIGYPLLLLPFYLAFGPFPGNAIYATLACSIMTLAATYACSRKLFGTTAALLTVLLLSSSWLFIEAGMEVRSDMLACFLMVLSFLIFISIIKKESGRHFASLLLGITLGCSYTVRPPNLVLLVVIPFAILVRRGHGAAMKSLAIIAAGMAVILVPYMAFCNAAYGAPLRTGYQVWMLTLPGRAEDTGLLSPRNIALNISHRWLPSQPRNAVQRMERILRTTNGAFYSSAILGLNRVYNPAVFIFIVLGISCSLRKPNTGRNIKRLLSLCLVSIIALSILFYMMLPVNLYRYMLPVLPLLLAFAGYGMARKVEFTYRKRIRPASLLYIVLFAIAISPAGNSIYRRVTRSLPPPYQYEICRTYRGLSPPDGCIISGIDSVLLDHFILRESERTLFALSPKSLYVDQRFRLKPGDAPTASPIEPASRHMDEIRAMIDEGKTVLMDDWESPFHPGRYRDDLDMMRANFVLEEVSRKGPFHVYRLSNPPADPATRPGKTVK